MRWARENSETETLSGILTGSDTDRTVAWWTFFGASAELGPAAIDLDYASVELTYREATDLRWALDLWRESGARWRGEPRQPG